MNACERQFRSLVPFSLTALGCVFCLAGTPAKAQLPPRAVDELDRALRTFGEVWVRAERARLRASRASASPLRLCTTPWTSWGNRIDAAESQRIENPWNRRVYDARDDFDLLVPSLQSASFVCIAIDSQLTHRASVPGSLGSDAGAASNAWSTALSLSLARVRAEANSRPQDTLTWRALMFLALFAGDFDTLRDGADECIGTIAPCSAWKVWVERLRGASPHSPPTYAADAGLSLVGACLSALVEPPPLLPSPKCDSPRDAATFWWAADPFWSTTPNERRDVQIDRALLLHLLGVLRSDGRMNWRNETGGDALREAVFRFGWPTAVSLSRGLLTTPLAGFAITRMAMSTGPGIGLDHEWQYEPHVIATVPRAPFDVAPSALSPSAWATALRPERREGVPALQHHAEWWSPPCPISDVKTHQRVVLKRRRVNVLVASVSGASQLQGSVMVSSSGANGAPVIHPVRWLSGDDLVAHVPIDTNAVAFSMERPFSEGCRPSSIRARFGRQFVSLPDGSDLSVSAPLLLSRPPALVRQQLQDTSMIALATTDSTVATGAPVIMYFEVYKSDHTPVTAEVQSRRRLTEGPVRDLGVRTGLLSDRRTATSVSFEVSNASENSVQIVGGGPHDFGTVLELSTLGLVAGEYELQVIVTDVQGRKATKSVVVQLR